MDQKNRDELVKKHLPMIEQIVSIERKRLGVNPDMLDDMRSSATEALIKAADRYDPSHNTSFKTFSWPRVRGAVYDGISQMNQFPRRLQRKIKFYRQSNERLQHHMDTPPPQDKVDSVHQIADRLSELATAYVTTYATDGENELASTPANAEFETERKRFSKRLHLYVTTLPKKQRAVIEAFYFEDMNVKQIAQRMEVTPSWISKLLTAAHHSLSAAFMEPLADIDDFQIR
jgi:RNA polymerase sigma factor FliA